MDYSLPGSSVHSISLARILEWIAISFSRESSWPRDRTQVCIAGRFFTIWATKEVTFHAKVGTIKDRNGVDLTEAEDIKKRWQKYTEELYKKDLHNSDNHNGIITNLEPEILESEVTWALGSITKNKLVKVIEFQLSCFKS